ncbi:phage tail protein, partial [Burkholderia pseudomultivorans]|nr:phage tail protein [Burkholderia pseudomultivorans]
GCPGGAVRDEPAAAAAGSSFPAAATTAVPLWAAPADAAGSSAAEAATDVATEATDAAQTGTAVVAAAGTDVAAAASAESTEPAPADKSTLHVSRPSQNELTLTVNGESITLHPEQLGQLIEELAHARASMQPEPPQGIPPGWRFVSTKNPMMAVQKQSNGDRLLVARHTGYGWVPFTFSPDVVIQMYMMLTQR